MPAPVSSNLADKKQTVSKIRLLSPETIALAVILFLALGLRLWGITWALPNESRYFSYHPDESVVVGAALRVNPFLALLDPGFYNYGTFYLLVSGGAIHLGEAVGLVGQGAISGIPSASALLTARLVSVLLGTGTCALLYATGKRLYSSVQAGLTAATLFAVAPLAVQHSHFATVDISATFFITTSLYFTARYLSPERKARDLIWAGVCCGLAAATKYNALLVLFAPLMAVWITRKLTPSSAVKPALRPFIGLLLGTIGGFLFGCPTIVLNPVGVAKAIQSESLHVGSGHGDVFTGTVSGFIYHIEVNLNWGLGWGLLIVTLVGVGYALWRRRPGDLVLLAFVVPYYLLIGLAEVKFARYTLPLFPPLLLFAGALIPTEGRGAKIVGAAVGAAAIFALLMSCGFDSAMVRPDPRDQAAEFIKTKNPSSVGFATGPWFYSPPLNPLFAAFNPQMAKKAANETQNRRLIAAEGEWNLAQFRESKPDAIALSEYEYADAQRIGKPEALAYIAAVQKELPVITVVDNPIEFIGIPISVADRRRGLPAQRMPHDMTYTNPITIVFTR